MDVLALKVLDDLHFTRAAIVERLDLRGDATEASESRCTESPCSNDQLEVLTQRSHENWLQDAMRANARSELI